MTRRCRRVPVHVPLEWRTLAGNPVIVVWDEMCQPVVSHPPGHQQKMPAKETPAVSTRKQEENKLVTDLGIVKLSGRSIRRHLGLCYCENSLRGERNGLVPREDHCRLGCVPWTPLDWILQELAVVPTQRRSQCNYFGMKRRNPTGVEFDTLPSWSPDFRGCFSRRTPL